MGTSRMHEMGLGKTLEAPNVIIPQTYQPGPRLQIQQLKSKLDLNKAAIRGLKTAIESKTQAVDKLRVTNRDLVVDAEQLESKLDLRETTIRDLKTAIAYKEQAVDELKVTNRDLVVDAEQLKSKIDLKEVTSRDLETTIAYKEQAVDELKATNRDMETTIAYKDQAIDELKATNRDLETTIAYKNQAVDELKATNRDLKADVEQMESKLDINADTIRGLRIVMTCREQAIDELKVSKRDLEASVEQSESKLASQGIYMSRGEATIQDLGTVNARLLQTQETIGGEISSLYVTLIQTCLAQSKEPSLYENDTSLPGEGVPTCGLPRLTSAGVPQVQGQRFTLRSVTLNKEPEETNQDRTAALRVR
ncbi:MAG: hypothetical protein ASARMPRED_007531 [Alectoria sarmentosa]|nr:MAG: hypothetical protein ASARMPRED_007531 [Alectoria sarmentosa]